MIHAIKLLTKTLFFTVIALCYTSTLSAQSDEPFVTISFGYTDLESKDSYDFERASLDEIIDKTSEFMDWEVNESEKGWYMKVKAKKQVRLDGFSINTKMGLGKSEKMFCNGLQSWSHSREFSPDEKIKKPGPLVGAISRHYGDKELYSYKAKKGRLHSWTYTYLLDEGVVTFFGSLNEASGYTLFTYDDKTKRASAIKDCGGRVLEAGDNYYLMELCTAEGSHKEVFDEYGELYSVRRQELLREAGIKYEASKAKPEPGWTSWYHYFMKIDEEIIIENLNNFKEREVKLGMFQIDDGWQQAVGDWHIANEKFPKGMKYLADEIHDAGYQAGIWLAPFICVEKSEMYQNHPDWLLKNKKGKPLKVGINPGWGGGYFAIDIYNPEFREYLKGVFDSIYNRWGYDMVKVDFLFAAHVQPNAQATRGKMMTDGMTLLRELAGDKYILGCGVPIGPSLGLVDYCRIGSDIHMKWDHKLLKWGHMRERLSTWNSLNSTIGRYQLGGRLFLNDPDVYVLRTEKNSLTDDEKYTTFLVNNILGQLVFTSDNIANYSAEQMTLYKSCLPLLEKKVLNVNQSGQLYTISFVIGERAYVAYINLGTGKKEITLEGAYFNGQTGELFRGTDKIIVKPHQSICLYKTKMGEPDLLGGIGYLFPGAETVNLKMEEGRITYQYIEDAQQDQPVYIQLPNTLASQTLTINGAEYSEAEIKKAIIVRNEQTFVLRHVPH